jgi:hypothetical protein
VGAVPYKGAGIDPALPESLERFLEAGPAPVENQVSSGAKYASAEAGSRSSSARRYIS